MALHPDSPLRATEPFVRFFKTTTNNQSMDYNASNKLPIFASFSGVEKFRAYSATLVGNGMATDPLSFNQRQLLHWHR